MIQQSHQQLNDSTHLRKYLPLSSLLLTDSRNSQQPSFLFTPQNYMLVLSYCTSLEREIEGLKNKLIKAENANQQLWNKNNGLQSVVRQYKNGRNVEGTPKFGTATSFGMINSCRVERRHGGRSQQKQCVMGESFFDGEIINILKEQNQSLKRKIQMLYKQNLKITENYQKYLKLSLKDARNIDFENFSDQQQLFEKVELMDTLTHSKTQNQQQNLSQKSRFYRNKPVTNAARPQKKVILSEPNSCDISFQALPSFKSMDDMNNKNLRFDCANFF